MFSPLVRHKRLIAELKRLRDEAGMTSDQLAKSIGQSRMKISRLENAAGRPSPSDVMKILDALEVPEPRWSQLLSLANEAGHHGWWEDYGDHIGARQQTYANLEYGAATVCEYQNNVIPGLLQVEAYVRGREDYTLAHEPSRSKRMPEKAIEARQVRQRVLRRADGPRYEVIVEEIAVRRPAAPPHSMREQLMTLAELAAGNNKAEIRVLPIEAEIEGYWIAKSPFSLYTYAANDDPDAVAIDTETEDLVYTTPEHVEPYQEMYRRLREAALPPAESADFLKGAAEHFALRMDTKGRSW